MNMGGRETRIRAALTRPLSTRAAILIVCAAGIVAAALIMAQARGLTFFYDEWNVVQDRRAWNVDAFLLPHNEHLIAVPALLFKILFVAFGLTAHWPYALLLVISHLACTGVVFALARRWSSNEFAVVVTLAMLFLGSAWEILLWPFEMGITIALGAGLGAILALHHQTRRGDLIACGLLVLSLASDTLGIPLAIGALALIVMQRRFWSRLYVVLVPIALYGIWYLKYGFSTAKLSNATEIPGFNADSAAAVLGALSGFGEKYGAALAIGMLVIVALALIQRWSCRAALVPLLITTIAMWSLICLARFGVAPPNASRYIYPGAALVVIIGACVVARRSITSLTARTLVIALLVASLLSNVGELQAGARLWQQAGEDVRSSLGAMTEARRHLAIPADFQPNPYWAPQIKAQTYFAAADALGSPAWTAPQILAATPAARAAADSVLLRLRSIAVTGDQAEAVGATPPVVETIAAGTPQSGSPKGCITSVPNPGATPIVIGAVPPEGLLFRAQRVGAATTRVDLRVARYAELGPQKPIGTAVPGGPALRVRASGTDPTPPWRFQLSSLGPITFCRAR